MLGGFSVGLFNMFVQTKLRRMRSCVVVLTEQKCFQLLAELTDGDRVMKTSASMEATSCLYLVKHSPDGATIDSNNSCKDERLN